MEINKLKNILEAVLLAADRTLTVIQLEGLFELDEERPSRDEIRQALHEMAEDYESRGYELNQVASGFRLQVRQEYATWVGRLWEERPARYTRALLETMALIAYRQPITRGEIEEVRGVSVSSNIIKTLLERDWIKVLGHKDVPGKPSLYGTTKEFLDYFNLKSLDQLPTLAEIKDLDSIHPELALDESAEQDTEKGNDDSNHPESSLSEENAAVSEVDSGEQGDVEVDSENVSDEILSEEGTSVESKSEDESSEEDGSEEADTDTVRSAFNV
jgi:segregation and condensation protein B